MVWGGTSIIIEPSWQCFVAMFDSALDTRTSLARLGIVVLSVSPSSLLALRIPSMSKYSVCFV